MFVVFMLNVVKEVLLELAEENKTADKMTDKMTASELVRWDILSNYLQTHGILKNAKAKNLLSVSDTTAKRFLKKMVSLGVLEAVGERKAREYRLK